MSIAGGDFDTVFRESTHKMLYNATQGVPRDLCILCNAALVNAFALNRKTVDEAVLNQTLQEYAVKDWASPYEPMVANG
jgi:type II secretory pathway predicted ATPase ExeA